MGEHAYQFQNPTEYSVLDLRGPSLEHISNTSTYEKAQSSVYGGRSLGCDGAWRGEKISVWGINQFLASSFRAYAKQTANRPRILTHDLLQLLPQTSPLISLLDHLDYELPHAPLSALHLFVARNHRLQILQIRRASNHGLQTSIPHPPCQPRQPLP